MPTPTYVCGSAIFFFDSRGWPIRPLPTSVLQFASFFNFVMFFFFFVSRISILGSDTIKSCVSACHPTLQIWTQWTHILTHGHNPQKNCNGGGGLLRSVLCGYVSKRPLNLEVGQRTDQSLLIDLIPPKHTVTCELKQAKAAINSFSS